MSCVLPKVFKPAPPRHLPRKSLGHRYASEVLERHLSGFRRFARIVQLLALDGEPARTSTSSSASAPERSRTSGRRAVSDTHAYNTLHWPGRVHRSRDWVLNRSLPVAKGDGSSSRLGSCRTARYFGVNRGR